MRGRREHGQAGCTRAWGQRDNELKNGGESQESAMQGDVAVVVRVYAIFLYTERRAES